MIWQLVSLIPAFIVAAVLAWAVLALAVRRFATRRNRVHRDRKRSGRLNRREEFEFSRMARLFDREAQEPSPRTEGTGRDD